MVLFNDRFGPTNERRRNAVIIRKQPWPRHRRKWHSDLELWIIAPARARVRISPAMIEDIFALTMAFGIGGQRTCEAAVSVFDNDRDWLPARLCLCAARRFECR